jgi:hypothetical protein
MGNMREVFDDLKEATQEMRSNRLARFEKDGISKLAKNFEIKKVSDTEYHLKHETKGTIYFYPKSNRVFLKDSKVKNPKKKWKSAGYRYLLNIGD